MMSHAVPAPTAREMRSPGSRSARPGRRFLLWADAIGGYLVCLDDEVTLGRAGPDGSADVPLLGDLSRRHASIPREGEHYTMRAVHATFVNGRADRVVPAPRRRRDPPGLDRRAGVPPAEPGDLDGDPAGAEPPSAADGGRRRGADGPELPARARPGNATSRPRSSSSRSSCSARPTPSGAGAPAASRSTASRRLARAPLTMRSGVMGEGFSFSLEPFESRGAAAV